MTCDQSIELIASAIEGRVAPIELDTLMTHLTRCPACSIEAKAQTTVKRLLAARPEEAPPEGFALRLAARLDAEAPLGAPQGIDWRKWTVRLLPTAAGLVLVAGLVHRALPHSPSDQSADLPAAVASWAHARVRDLQTPVDVELSDRALLWASLMEAMPKRDPTPAGNTTPQDGKKDEGVR